MSSATWSSPQTPLSPDRLAKIANALGVSTPTPSVPARTPPTTSSYLVHVVPPLTLPHLNSSLTSPPPPTASGYHSHFRRGTLLPVYATLQLQLVAIAREYALPSTTGLILYLVQEEIPGPRISEDIWKHLWARVWRAEFAPDAPQKLSALTLHMPESERSPIARPSPADRASVPIVAKVEFDVDARAAPWFNPWITSRNINHNKRMEYPNSPITLTLPRTPLSEHTSMFNDADLLLRNPGSLRKNIPPRLILDTFGLNTDSSSGSASTSLAYLQQPESSDEDTEIEEEGGLPTGKRGGGVYEDLDLDFDESFQETEETQYLLTAKLDQIERNLAQFSPRVLSVDLQEEQDTYVPLRTDLRPPNPLNPTASWPAVPFTSLNSPLIMDGNRPPSPPQLAVNGVTTSAPKSFNPVSSSGPSSETFRRRKQLEEEEWGSQGQYPKLTPQVNGGESVIPLSPDPFGRFSSSTTPQQPSERSSTYWEDSSTVVDETRTASSRFSADSLKGEPTPNPNRATIMSVKSIKRLWRRSSKQAVVLQQPMPPPPLVAESSSDHRFSGSININSHRNSIPPTSATDAPSRPSRPSTRPPSLHNFDIPEVVDQPFPQKTAPPITTIGLDRLRFDQESPYPNPTRRSRAPAIGTYPSSGSTSGKASPTLPTPPSGKVSPTPENPRNSVRKSILKWKSGGGRARSTSMLSVNNEQRPSMENMPPSPRIPEQFLQQQQQGMRSHTQDMSISSMAPSVISVSKSVSSNGTRYSEDEGRGPSIDDQFEIVNASLKNASNSLSYPYTTVDRDD